jgi:hypothetical protein
MAATALSFVMMLALTGCPTEGERSKFPK